MSYETDIIKTLAKMGKNGTINPDAKHNTGSMLGEAFMWDRIEAYARNRSEAAWAVLAKEGLIPDKKTLDPGDHQLAQSPNFAVFARVTQPVRRFSGDELANLLAKSRYKVPVSTTKELIDQAKMPTNSMVTLKIVERG